MSNDNWDNNEAWKEEDGGLFGTHTMSPEARNILKHISSMGITKGEAEGVTIKSALVPNVDSEPMPLFRPPSNQDENQYLTPGAKKIAWHLDQMGITDNGPVKSTFKLESVPMPQGIPAPDNISNQPTGTAALDETAHYFKQVEEALEKRKAETAEKIAYYRQNGWPTYDSENKVAEMVHREFQKRDGVQNRPDDALLAQAENRGAMRDISTGLYETETNSDPVHGAIEAFFSGGSQVKETPDQDNSPAQKNTPSFHMPTDRFSAKINERVGGRRQIETRIDMRIFDALEESSKTGTVPSDTSGFTIAMGVDLSQHTLSYFEGKVSDETMALLKTTLKDFLKKEDGTLGPTGAAAKALIRQKGLGGGKFQLTEAQENDFNHNIVADKLNRCIQAYENARKDHPNALPFEQLPSEVQTVIGLRFYQRESRWNKGPGPDPKNLPPMEFYKVLMQGGDDPVKFKSDLAKALKRDGELTGNKYLKGRYPDEALFMDDMKAFEEEYKDKLKRFKERYQ